MGRNMILIYQRQWQWSINFDDIPAIGTENASPELEIYGNRHNLLTGKRFDDARLGPILPDQAFPCKNSKFFLAICHL